MEVSLLGRKLDLSHARNRAIKIMAYSVAIKLDQIIVMPFRFAIQNYKILIQGLIILLLLSWVVWLSFSSGYAVVIKLVYAFKDISKSKIDDLCHLFS